MIAATSFPLTPLALFVLAAPQTAQDPVERARKLFVTNCATCHGERGDGQGTTRLDRPARSFMDGGFSFGNTPEALFRTISVGIPGTPMPGFDSSLSEEERRVVASYVVTLGPPIEEVEEEDMILEVRDRPLVVRGLLPSLGEGLPQHPRGLLIGDPSGITFEYRVDDVRLLALRQGGFVRRTDWSGRGGTPLEPLGKVVHLIEGGKPEASFYGLDKPLSAKLSGTRSLPPGTALPMVDGGGAIVRTTWNAASLEYHLVLDGRELAHVREVPHVEATSFGTGYQRDFWLVAGSSASTITFRTPSVTDAPVLARKKDEFGSWSVTRAPGAPPILTALEADASSTREVSGGRLEASLAVKPGAKDQGFTVVSLVLVDWSPEIERQVVHYWEER